ncbi:MAG: hypothetical protein NZO58_13800 [Gemmataceae bacterium]|nr:hypothetical protein [Gemmataceae bacterium]
MATATPPAVPGLDESLAKNLRLAAVPAALVLLGLGGVKLVTSVLSFPEGVFLALLGLIEGALTVLLGLILIKIATDLRYAAEVPTLSALHFMNALESWQDFCKTLIAVAVFALVGALLRL